MPGTGINTYEDMVDPGMDGKHWDGEDNGKDSSFTAGLCSPCPYDSGKKSGNFFEFSHDVS